MATRSIPVVEFPKAKQKLVRDSFTIPKGEYARIADIKQRAAKLARPAKKSEVLRAGIAALNAMSDKDLLAALNAVPALKTGRPKDDSALDGKALTKGAPASDLKPAKKLEEMAGRAAKDAAKKPAKKVARKAAAKGAAKVATKKAAAVKPAAKSAVKRAAKAAGNTVAQKVQKTAARKAPARKAAAKKVVTLTAETLPLMPVIESGAKAPQP